MLIVANGMPRSGSTLQYNALRMIVEQTGTGVAEGYAAPDETRTNYVSSERLVEWAADETLHLIKSHSVHPNLLSLSSAGRTKACYIFRDLRDVAVSRRVAWGDAGDVLFEGLDRSVGWYWEMRAIQAAHPDAVLWQDYAEVIGDLPESVGALARFLEVPLPANVVDEIVSSCTVEAVKPQVEARKRDLQELIQSLRKRDPRLAGQLVQQLGRGRDRAEMVFRDAHTLVSYNQISPFKGAVGICLTPRRRRRS